MSAMELHFGMLDTDEDKPEEDLIRSLLSILSYSSGSLSRGSVSQHKIVRHMRSEYLRIQKKIK